MVSLRGVIVALVAALLAAPDASARTGLLDREFGRRGLVRTDFGPGSDAAAAAVLQPDGRILVAGHARRAGGSEVALARFSPAGALDPTFGRGGRVWGRSGHDEAAAAVALTPEAGILVAGSTRASRSRRALLVARYTPDGALDPAFGEGGRVILEIGEHTAQGRAVVVSEDGSAYVAGSYRTGRREQFLIVRLDPAGRLDPRFGEGGVVRLEVEAGGGGAFAASLLEDGRIVLAGRAGRDLAVVRLDGDGRPDGGFADHGVARIDVEGGFEIGRAVAVQPDGRILVAGTTSRRSGSDFVLARLTDDGELDPKFGEGGVRRTDFGGIETGHAIALLPGGTIIVGGRAVTGEDGADLALAAYRPDGSLEPSFGRQGRVRTDLQSGGDGVLALVAQPDGRLVAAGVRGAGLSGEMALVRYHDAPAECGDGYAEGSEACDEGDANGAPSSCCSATCELRPATHFCRPAAGLCDVAESCTGATPTCPADEIRPADFACRPTAGWCDLSEVCSGVSKRCPADRVRGSDAVCRAAVGACDAAESCDGETPQCPADEKSTDVCRPADGDCDVPETCDGVSDHCPGDRLQENGNACYDRNPCTVDEVCHEGKCIGGTFEPFKCAAMVCRKWKAKPKPEVEQPEATLVRHVRDGFEDGALKFKSLNKTFLCSRASLNGETWSELSSADDPVFAEAPPKHRASVLVTYEGSAPISGLIVSDRFGRRPVSIARRRERKLSMPARVDDGSASAAPLFGERRKCYVVEGQRSVGIRGMPLWLGEDSLLFDVKKLKQVCVPAEVDDVPSDSVTAVACYSAERSRGESPPVRGEAVDVVTEQGHQWTLTEGDREYVCVPATVEPLQRDLETALSD